MDDVQAKMDVLYKYEEKLINGALHYRTIPNGTWIAFTSVELSFMLISSRQNAAAQRMCHAG